MVFPATSVEEAMQVFSNENYKFHLIFSDVVLPDGSGIELVSWLSKLDPEVKILLSSGYADEKAQFSLIQEKGYFFLQKPYKVDTLLQKIKKILSMDKVKLDTEKKYVNVQ